MEEIHSLEHSRDRTILHCDCNGFYASVECLLHPEFRNVPMAVCGDPESRHGIILAKNELAKQYDIRTAETIWQAKQKCPNLVLARPHHGEYAKYSRIVNQIYLRYTDQVEPFGIDESWLDVTGSRLLFGSGEKIADELRETVRRETGLTISVGVSFNKIFAKLGSDYKKPDATTVISRENYKDIVFPLPADSLLYVGKSARAVLKKLRIRTIGELAASNREVLWRHLGKMGAELWDYANGLDRSPVRCYYDPREIKSVGNGMTFRRNLAGEEDIRVGILTLADSVAARMRRHKLKCTTVQVTIRNPSFHTITRQKKLPFPTHLAKDLAEASMELIAASWKMEAPIRMLTITGSGLVSEDFSGEQISLFEEDQPEDSTRQEQLENTLDAIRGKYGKSALTFGAILHNDLGIDTLPRKTDTDLSEEKTNIHE
ncbi:MAG: DNA polymerase IV [Hydrogeniiclostridium sp.]